MRVKKIIGFGRVIKINSDDMQYKKIKDIYPDGVKTTVIKKIPYADESQIDKSTNEICKILNSKPSKMYSDKQAERIRDFFKSVLGDYNGKDGIVFEKNNKGDILLISGDNCKEYKKIMKKAKYLPVDTIRDRLNKKIFKKLEGPKNNQPEAAIDFKSGFKTKSGLRIFNKFIYNTTDIFSGKINDGIIKEEREYNPFTRAFYKVEYSQKSLEL